MLLSEKGNADNPNRGGISWRFNSNYQICSRHPKQRLFNLIQLPIDIIKKKSFKQAVVVWISVLRSQVKNKY